MPIFFKKESRFSIFGNLDCGFWIYGTATLYQLQWIEFLKSKIQIQKSKIVLNLYWNRNGLKKVL
ncbi:hypothetical protein D1AOALGA4SA_5103 [Olavius algarvensis Delta 1 endosymbiont]|nr:hypothetical protein D1AOALGA4SA_5103 [Olavius algarvensis Delta 1 endosymbiont]